jgi:hypothetical protein
MTDSTSQGSELQVAVPQRESQGGTGAAAGSGAGPPSGQASGGWDPFEVWLQRIEQPRRGKGAATRR